MPGANSQGAVEIERMFCASCSNTPQLTTGGCRPRPRKLSEVSARIITGMARLTAAMMWLAKDGTMWRKMMRRLARAVEPRGYDEILGPQRQEAAAHDARQIASSRTATG